MNAPAGPVEVHLGQWLDADPEARLTELFVAEARAPAQRLVQAIAHELHLAVFHAPDPRVGAAKLGWWMEQLGPAPQHPLARGLVEDGAPAQALSGLRAATAPLLRLATCESFESLQQWLDPLAQAGEAIADAAAAVGLRAPAQPAGALAAARLVEGIREWRGFALAERGRVPLDLLARHRVDRAAAEASAPLAGDLSARLATALAQAPAGVLRGPDGARIARALVNARRMAARPQAWLEGRLRAPRAALVFASWRVGRRG
jgi:hypothetical protein